MGQSLDTSETGLKPVQFILSTFVVKPECMRDSALGTAGAIVQAKVICWKMLGASKRRVPLSLLVIVGNKGMYCIGIT